MANKTNIDEEILLRLDVIAKLLINAIPAKGGNTSTSEKIVLLKNMGLSNNQITSFTGKQGNYIRSVIIQSKRRRKK